MRKTLAVFSAVAVLGAGGTVVADRQIDPYTDKGTHYELPIKADFEQGERVEIHKDKAQMDLVFWNDENTISIIPQIPTALLGAKDKPFTAPADRPLLSKKMEFKSGDVTAFIEPKEGTENEFDIDFTLDSKPDTNVFTYKIEGAEEFDFFYQPELTPEEIAQGSERPENVIGSYAVYHKTKANHRIGSTNYATGKAFHIYRPKALDANGAEVWAELNYENGTLSVVVPQEWLQKAAYPVRIDPQFGYTGAGASVWGAICSSTPGNAMAGVNATLSESGNIIKVSAYLVPSGSITTDYYSAIFNEDSAAANSHDRVASAEIASSTFSADTRFWDITYASELLTADTYVLAVLCSSTGAGLGNISLRNDTGAGNRGYFENTGTAGGYATRKAENPWTEIDAAIANMSIYATYQPVDTGGTYTDTFSGPGNNTWTAPTGVTSADVACWGGGGGGETDLTNSGAGGGGGAFASSTVAVTAGNNYTVTVASTSAATLPTTGKFSSFVGDDKTVKACGGTGATSRTANGVGGTTACSTGDVEAAGGDGADGSDPDGGGGGGAAGPNGAGVIGEAAGTGSFGDGGAGNNGVGGAGGNSSGEAGTSDSSGGGGGAGGDNTANGGAGGTPGAGGGGGAGSGGGPATGGTGAGGQCTITYTVSAGGGGTTVNRQSIIWFIED